MRFFLSFLCLFFANGLFPSEQQNHEKWIIVTTIAAPNEYIKKITELESMGSVVNNSFSLT
jgi:hypothetical protein